MPFLPGHPTASFKTTCWTQVRQAKLDSDDGREALANLCHAYYEPVIAFLRCKLGDADTAREMAHAFFAEILAGGGIARAEREQGRFRSYLLGAVKHYVSHQRESAQSQKRGGGALPVSLDDDASAMRTIPDARQISPDAAFDRQWALSVLAQAMSRLQSECAAEGKQTQFETLKPWLMGDAAHGDQAALAAACGMGLSALKMAVQRLRQRFRDCLQTEIAATLDDASMVQEEMRTLLAALTT
jgi:DNA-directed RNA polymerase specialized sigma24 family protein